MSSKEDFGKKQLEKGYEDAKDIIENVDKVEKLLQQLERKLKKVPFTGDKLSYIPSLISLVRSYVRKEYTEVPLGSIIAIISALVYFVTPIDVILDSIPFLGYMDDAIVVGACWNLVANDVADYLAWRTDSGKVYVKDYEFNVEDKK